MAFSRIKDSWHKALWVCLLAFIWLAFVFILHRLTSYQYLKPEVAYSLLKHIDFLWVGGMSDLWVAALGSFIVLNLTLVSTLLGIPRNVQRVTLLVLALGLLGLTCLHQPYTEYFRFQILPHHLKYFGDFSFIGSNGATALNIRGVFIFLSGLYCLFFLATKVRPALTSQSARKLSVLTLFTFITCTGLHSANIHYRVQHFVPESLQSHYMERLYRSALVPTTPDRLKASELALLRQSYGIDVSAYSLSTLGYKPQFGELLPIAHHLKQLWQEEVEARRKPLVLTILLESARPSENGSYQPDKSYTPHFDKLASTGILFKQAYATGATTRSAQEAVLCGHISTQFTSMMRERPDIKIPCLPEQIRRASRDGTTFWLHGGRGEFDGQEVFWRGQMVDTILTQSDFPAKAVKTGWGVSDQELLTRSAAVLKDLRSKRRARFLLGTILTVSNHIPWELPSDSPASIASESVEHPSYRTTAYTDWAMGNLTSALKQQGLWQNSIVIIVGDHGNGVPARTNLYGHAAQEELLVHVPLLVTGGLTERASRSEPIVIETPVSQASVASFLRFLVDLPMASGLGYAAPLFSTQARFWPVISDTGKRLFFPNEKFSLSRTVFIGGDMEPLSTTQRREALFYRAYLRSLNLQSAFKAAAK